MTKYCQQGVDCLYTKALYMHDDYKVANKSPSIFQNILIQVVVEMFETMDGRPMRNCDVHSLESLEIRVCLKAKLIIKRSHLILTKYCHQGVASHYSRLYTCMVIIR